MRAKAYYSIVQYCPDYTRAEVCNVGVVWLELRRRTVWNITGDVSRVLRFFPRCDAGHVERTLKAFENRLWEGLDDLDTVSGWTKFAAGEANEIVLTPLRPCANDEDTLAGLYELVLDAE